MKIRAPHSCLAMLAVLNACQPTPPTTQVCTLIGCSDGVTVVVQNAPPTPYTVQVTLPDGSRRAARCEAAPGCGAGVFVADVSADELTVEVIGSGGRSSQVVRPSYEVSRPNGPSCPPVCRQARVQVRYAP